MMCGPTGAFSGKGFDRAGLHGAHHSLVVLQRTRGTGNPAPRYDHKIHKKELMKNVNK